MSNRVVQMPLPEELADKIARFAAEKGTDPAIVIEEAFENLRAEDGELDRFIDEEAVPALEEFLHDPSTGRTPEQVDATLRATYLRLLEEQELRKAG